jgi:hypothetical protein
LLLPSGTRKRAAIATTPLKKTRRKRFLAFLVIAASVMNTEEVDWWSATGRRLDWHSATLLRAE